MVERGRRLEVIDTRTGAPATPRLADPAAPAPLRLVAPERPPAIDSQGRTVIRTQAWYDDKGPRQVVLTEEGEARLATHLPVFGIAIVAALGMAGLMFWPLLLAVPFLLARKSVRVALRKGATRFLDTINQPMGSGSSAG